MKENLETQGQEVGTVKIQTRVGAQTGSAPVHTERHGPKPSSYSGKRPASVGSEKPKQR